MKRRTLEQWKLVGLPVLFAGMGCLSLLLVLARLGIWKDSRFTLEKYAIGEGVASARFFAVFGTGAFALCTYCIYHLLRYDLGAFRRRRK
jgi:hypothetical protein